MFEVGKNKVNITTTKDGYISELIALEVAHAAKLLGAGRDKKSGGPPRRRAQTQGSHRFPAHRDQKEIRSAQTLAYYGT